MMDYYRRIEFESNLDKIRKYVEKGAYTLSELHYLTGINRAIIGRAAKFFKTAYLYEILPDVPLVVTKQTKFIYTKKEHLNERIRGLLNYFPEELRQKIIKEDTVKFL